MHQARKEGSHFTDTGIIDLLSNLDITTGEHADESAVQKTPGSAGIEDQEGEVEATQLDKVGDMRRALAEIDVGESSSGGEEGENEDWSTGGGGGGG